MSSNNIEPICLSFNQINIVGVPTLSGEIREEDFAEGLDLVVKSFDALDLGGVFRTFFGVDVVLAALEPDLIMENIKFLISGEERWSNESILNWAQMYE